MIKSADVAVTINSENAVTINVVNILDNVKPTVSISGTRKLRATQTAVVNPAKPASGSYTYQWYKVSLLGRQTAIAGATSQTYKPTALGTYMVKVKTPAGIEVSSSKIIILRLF